MLMNFPKQEKLNTLISKVKIQENALNTALGKIDNFFKPYCAGWSPDARLIHGDGILIGVYPFDESCFDDNKQILMRPEALIKHIEAGGILDISFLSNNKINGSI